MNAQSGLAKSASRPASTAQLTGLYAAAVAIQSGTSARGMNAADRKVSGTAGSADRWEIEVLGGASEIRVEGR